MATLIHAVGHGDFAGRLLCLMPQINVIKMSASTMSPQSLDDGGRAGGYGRARGATAEGAVVETATLTLEGELPAVAEVGETVHVDFEGAPVQLRLTDWLKPATPATLRL
jgi:hypothetical protein